MRAECLTRLKGGAAPAELLREFSPGPVYDAVREYLTYSAGEVGEIRRSREREQEAFARVKEEGRVAGESAAARKVEAESLIARVRALDEQVKVRERSVAELRQTEERLNSKLKEYSGRGITDATFRRLDRFNFGLEDELISRLDTVERHRSLESEAEKKNTEQSNLILKVKELQREKAGLEAEILGLRSSRDEELKENFIQVESIRILSTFYNDGYTSEDIEGIRIGLSTLGIGGDPKTSVRRLIDFLGGELELTRLRTEIDARTEELRVLHNTIELVKGQLTSYKDAALAALREAEAASKKTLEGVYAQTVGGVKATGEEAGKQIQSVTKNHMEAIDKAAKTGVSVMMGVHEMARQEIEETVSSLINEVKTTIKGEFQPYRKALEVLPMIQPFAEYGFYLMRVPMDTASAQRVPIMFVSLMANSIDAWVKAKLPEAKTKPPSDVTLLAPMLGIESPCKLFAVSTWLRQELANRTMF